METYSDIFSSVYDRFGWNYYPDSFADLLLAWIAQEGLKVRKALDIGCGTGVLAARLAQKGIESAGMDLSEGMIRVARQHYPHLRFETGDMVTYRSEEQFDLVTATCDALNHITDPEDLRRVFQNVFAYTASGGVFLFDLLREEEARTCPPVDLGQIDADQVIYQILREGDRVTLQIDICSEGRQVHTERIHERLYEPEMIIRLLREAGFDRVRCTDRLLAGQTEHAATWFVIAQKPCGQ